MDNQTVFTFDGMDIPNNVRVEGVDYHRFLLDRSMSLIVIVSAQVEIVYVNDNLLELTGYEREDLLGENPRKLITPEAYERGRAEVFEMVNADRRTGRPRRNELRTKAGDVIPTESRYCLLPEDPDGAYNGHAVISRDIRARKHREEKLQVMARVLRHNLRNDVGLIRGYAESLRDADDPAVRRAAETIAETADDLIRTGTKVRTVQEEIQAAPAVAYDTEVTGLVADVAAEFDEAHPDVSITVDAPDRPVRANTPRAYRTAVAELVENAIVHCPPGRAAVADIAVVVEDGVVRTRVRDVCDPIPQREIRVIRSGETDALSHASGIGLWLAKWIAETTGGEIAFDRYERDGRAGNEVTIRLREIRD